MGNRSASLVAMAFIAISALAIAVYIRFSANEGAKRRGAGPEEPSEQAVATADARAKTRRLLEQLRREHNPLERRRFVAEFLANRDEWLPIMLEVLDSDQRFEPAAMYIVSALDTRDSLGDLGRLARSGSPRLRAKAILAAEDIDPWSDDRLEDFLHDASPEVVVAALKIAALRPVEAQPWDDILRCFGHSERPVREAAVRAVRVLDQTGARYARIVSILETGAGSTRISAAAALGRAGVSKRAEELLCGLLGEDRSQELREAVLRTLATTPRVLADAAPIIGRLLRGSDAERELVLRVMERTRTITPLQIKDVVPMLGPRLRYLAARCLLTIGDKDGASILVDLLGTRPNSSQDGTALARVQRLAQQLLERASGQSHERLHGWREWLALQRVIAPQELPAAPTGW